MKKTIGLFAALAAIALVILFQNGVLAQFPLPLWRNIFTTNQAPALIAGDSSMVVSSNVTTGVWTLQSVALASNAVGSIYTNSVLALNNARGINYVASPTIALASTNRGQTNDVQFNVLASPVAFRLTNGATLTNISVYCGPAYVLNQEWFQQSNVVYVPFYGTYGYFASTLTAVGNIHGLQNLIADGIFQGNGSGISNLQGQYLVGILTNNTTGNAAGSTNFWGGHLTNSTLTNLSIAFVPGSTRRILFNFSSALSGWGSSDRLKITDPDVSVFLALNDGIEVYNPAGGTNLASKIGRDGVFYGDGSGLSNVTVPSQTNLIARMGEAMVTNKDTSPHYFMGTNIFTGSNRFGLLSIAMNETTFGSSTPITDGILVSLNGTAMGYATESIYSSNVTTLQFSRGLSNFVYAIRTNSVWIDAGAMRSSGSLAPFNGCPDSTAWTNQINVQDAWNFDDTTNECVVFRLSLGTKFAGTILGSIYWVSTNTASGGNSNIVWQFSCNTMASGGTAFTNVNNYFTTNLTVALQASNSSLQISSFPLMTVTNSTSHLIDCRLTRLGTNASDVLVGDAKMLGFVMRFTETNSP